MLGLGLSVEETAVMRPKGAAFTPLSLAPSAWYDPSDLSSMFKDTAGTQAVTADGDAVARINDKSGNGNHLIQATAANRPLYKTSAGLSWLLFDGVNDYMQVTFGAGLAQPNDVTAGFQFVAATENTYLFDGLAGARHGMLLTGGLCVVLGPASLGTSFLADTSAHVGFYSYNGASSAARHNGVASSALAGSVGTDSLGGLTLGAHNSGAGGANLKVFGFIVHPLALSASDRNSIEQYMAAKTGVSF